jgi:tagaturonate reductase
MRETILQLGAGRFLRAFVDRFVQQANDAGQDVGQIVVAQSTPGKRAELLRNPDGYSVLIRGYNNGELVNRDENVRSISRALVAGESWSELLEFAVATDLRYLVTNATEAGYSLHENDTLESAPPVSMPAKLTRILWERFQSRGSPLIILPCELIEQNATKLLEIVVGCAVNWSLPEVFQHWLRNACHWLVNLVDCIVTSPAAAQNAAALDEAAVQAEPYELWAIQRSSHMPDLFKHSAMRVVDDLTPFYLRKVRILNGLHTAMTAKFLPAGFEFVKDVLADADAVRWLRGLLWEEIVPTIAYRIDDVAEFADATWDRLRNPFVDHRLADIALHHSSKMDVRLGPTREEYRELFGCEPKRLNEVFSMNLE